jgi:hypothetical protein
VGLIGQAGPILCSGFHQRSPAETLEVFWAHGCPSTLHARVGAPQCGSGGNGRRRSAAALAQVPEQDQG